MTMTSHDPIYAVGRSEGERYRLVERAAIYACLDAHLLDEAGRLRRATRCPVGPDGDNQGPPGRNLHRQPVRSRE